MKKISNFNFFSILLASVLLIGLSSCAQHKKIRQMPIKDADLFSIKDGKYKGSFTYGKGEGFTYEVLTTVKNKRIADIEILKNRDTKHAKKAEQVIERIKQKQTPNVDAVSGATTTSKAFMKAVENSLLNPSDSKPLYDAIGCPDADADGVIDDTDECLNTPRGAEVDHRGCSESER
ncbi:MAG: FMN-binding protein [Desulfobacterales bacterium]|nr:FMN-binding protein [Desulfobacterales bacterium]